MKIHDHRPINRCFHISQYPVSGSHRNLFRRPTTLLLSLTLFVFGVFLVDHIEATLSADNLVLRGTLLD